eukprot:m.204851 g.204851  ORF g.204851 m.204851 type:complete len:121 (-) comp26039_c0_seq6:10922-11284(-)
MKKDVFKDDLSALQVPAEIVPVIVKHVYGERRVELEEHRAGLRTQLPKLDAFKWRVDVAVSTSALKRAMKPSMLFQMTLSDGSISTFEVPADQFHALRYNVAFVLKEMQELREKSVMQNF